MKLETSSIVIIILNKKTSCFRYGSLASARIRFGLPNLLSTYREEAKLGPIVMHAHNPSSRGHSGRDRKITRSRLSLVGNEVQASSGYM